MTVENVEIMTQQNRLKSFKFSNETLITSGMLKIGHLKYSQIYVYYSLYL